MLIFICFSIGRHTGTNIKKEFDKVVKFYEINDKVFKIIADQASNNKKAFGEEVQCGISQEIINATNILLLEMKKSDLAEKQQRLRRELVLVIQELNTVDSIEVAPENKTKKRKREESLLAEFNYDDFEEDFTEHSSVNNNTKDNNDTMNDIDETLLKDFLVEDEISIFIITLV